MKPIEQTTSAYDLFVEAHSLYINKDQAEIRAEINPGEFERQVRQLYAQWLAGEFSFGKFTEIIGVAHAELWEIFDALGLPRHR